MPRLTNLVYELPKTAVGVLKRCAEFFKLLCQPLLAAEVYEKIGDNWATVSLYIESKQWDTVCLHQFWIVQSLVLIARSWTMLHDLGCNGGQ